MAENGFDCAKCRGRFPYREGNATARGLVCRACTPQTTVTPAERASANAPAHGARTWLTTYYRVGLVADLIELIFGRG